MKLTFRSLDDEAWELEGTLLCEEERAAYFNGEEEAAELAKVLATRFFSCETTLRERENCWIDLGSPMYST